MLLAGIFFNIHKRCIYTHAYIMQVNTWHTQNKGDKIIMGEDKFKTCMSSSVVHVLLHTVCVCVYCACVCVYNVSVTVGPVL